MNSNDTIKTAIEIFKGGMPGAKGKFRACVSERNRNDVDIFSEAGLYCTVNVRSGMIKGV